VAFGGINLPLGEGISHVCALRQITRLLVGAQKQKRKFPRGFLLSI